MSGKVETTLANGILVQMGHTSHALNRLITAETYAMMSADERGNALLQLRLSAEVLSKLAEVLRVGAQMAQTSALAAAGRAAAT
ncbi:hypothetical protein DFP73DRAFT_635914 [Morchella snyderi]|nr:hypothetical protein DFP73DRAFT_635914 [Morchella snyderi]